MTTHQDTIRLYADETTAEQAARLWALNADPNTIYFAGDDHDRPDLPGWPLPADAWVWQTGNRWVATVAGFHANDWWEGSGPEDRVQAPDPWYRPISDVPATGTLIFYTRDGLDRAMPANLHLHDLHSEIRELADGVAELRTEIEDGVTSLHAALDELRRDFDTHDHD